MENTTKITKNQKLNAIIAVLDEIEMDSIVLTFGDEDVTVTKEDLVEYCEKEIEALAKKAAKAKETAAKKKAEDPLLDTVKAALTSDYQSIADITAKIAEDNPDISAAKVTYRLTSLIKMGEVEKTEISIPTNEGQKNRKIQGYRKICD